MPFERIDARLSFEEIESDTWDINGLRISSAPVCHPGATLAYRIAENGASLAFVPDNEPGLDAESGLAVAGGADVLLHDSQYTDEEYATRVGWGHTSLSDFAAYLRAASPRRAVMVHHDPGHDDEQLEEMLEQARARVGARRSAARPRRARDRDRLMRRARPDRLGSPHVCACRPAEAESRCSRASTTRASRSSPRRSSSGRSSPGRSWRPRAAAASASS